MIDDLRQRAFVDKADTEVYGVKRWVNSVLKLYEQGDLAILNNDLESAYVSYMRGCSIMVEIIKFHSCYHQVRQDPVFLGLKKRTNEEIFALLQDLALRIEAWYQLSRQQNQLQQPYYTNPYLHNNPTNATTQTASYAYIPSHDPRNYPHYSLNDLPAAEAATTAVAQTTQMPQNSMNQLVRNTANLHVSDNHVIQLPSWTNNQFSEVPVIEPIELAKLITTKASPPSVLLIDVRTREAFKNGCIKHQWIIQVEPIVLQHDVMIVKIQDSLLQNPEAEQTLFTERARFDLIVYYDQNSKTLETAYKPAYNMRRALVSGQLKHPPKMLAGGFDAWMSTVGERGVYRFPAHKEKKHWFKSSSSTSSNSTHSSREHDTHHSLYDYFAGKGGSHLPLQHCNNPISKPQPLPTAPRKESQTTRYPELLVPSELPTQQQQQPQRARDISPIPPSYPKLHRRRTFIDNPFNGFTTTTSKLYDVPPMSYHHGQTSTPPPPSTAQAAPTVATSTNLQIQTRPSSAEPTVSISRPSALAEFHHVSTNNIHSSSSPIISSSFSQLNSVVTIGTTGLKNLGNTCYMNSIVQCLSGTVPLARYLTSGVYRQHINKANKKGTGGALVEAFAVLVRSMWSENYKFISPMTFRETIMRFAPLFRNNDQHDSQEFLIFLLDGLHEDLNTNISNKAPPSLVIPNDAEFEKLPDWQASALSWDRCVATNSSIIVSLFQGQYRSRLICHTCKHTSTTYNTFMSLSLPIPSKKLRLSSVTLYQCLDYFVKEETLDKEDAWRCPKCEKKRKATKQLTLTRLPDVLLIHLKRFSMDGHFRNKLDATVRCATRGLDLSGYVPMSMTPSPPQDRPSFVYDLYAVSNHYGSISGGHYTACVRDGYSDKWHYFDDSKMYLLEESKVVTKAAYNLFYVRSRVK
ncbi:cysteine proteinase [Mucor ambiguus]|uniref:Ubiquitin carboxyl-terminal hydrolase n=1 Tax=Mucor ambiguus TaxID=91626 RepID=A0A0C9M924_9FUNG|nr:cysteine proteinase [Mucor ambiguus]